MIYYHVTTHQNAQKILRYGLKSNEFGQIFVFSAWQIENKNNKDKALICDLLAYNQLQLEEYAVLKINSKGIESCSIIESDNVGELTAKFQFIINQKRIDKKFIKFKDVRFLDSKKIDKLNRFINGFMFKA